MEVIVFSILVALTPFYHADVATALLSEILTNNASGAIMYPIAAIAGDKLGISVSETPPTIQPMHQSIFYKGAYTWTASMSA
jgi:threonine/homoserine efflux transporter RhtA